MQPGAARREAETRRTRAAGRRLLFLNFRFLSERVESEGGLDDAALVTGKYLSPKLYVSHGYGLFDQVSTFRARYLVSKKVTVQAETGAGSGGDVLYRLERGGR